MNGGNLISYASAIDVDTGMQSRPTSTIDAASASSTLSINAAILMTDYSLLATAAVSDVRYLINSISYIFGILD